MATRRTFIAHALASLAAAAGLSRLAGGAEGAEPAPAVPQPAQSRIWFELILSREEAEFCGEKWRVPYRVATFDESGRCTAIGVKRYVEVSPELPEAP